MAQIGGGAALLRLSSRGMAEPLLSGVIASRCNPTPTTVTGGRKSSAMAPAQQGRLLTLNPNAGDVL